MKIKRMIGILRCEQQVVAIELQTGHDITRL